jgi:hypothetical protein
VFRALKTSRDQTWTYNKHTHEGASPPNFFFLFFWPAENVKSPLQPAKIPIIKTSHLGHGVLPPRRENQKYLQLVRVTHPSSTFRTLIFPRAVFRFQKNDCYEQDPNILDLWAEFSSKLTMRGTFLWYRDVLLGSVWSSWWQQRQEIKTIFCVRLSKAHCLTLLTWSIIVVKH